MRTIDRTGLSKAQLERINICACGNECYGKTCSDCFRSHKHSKQVTRVLNKRNKTRQSFIVIGAKELMIDD
jgi:hypothetical protein